MPQERTKSEILNFKLTFAVAMDVARNAEPGSKILCMLADTAERYLSSLLFENIKEEMNNEELEIFNSTE